MKSPTIIVHLFLKIVHIFICSPISFYLTYFGALLLGACLSRIPIFLENWPLYSNVYYLSLFFFYFFLRSQVRHMDVPWLGVKSKLQLPAYAPSTAMPDLKCVCDLHHSAQKCHIFNPLNEARDQTWNLMDTSWAHYCWATKGTSLPLFISHFSCS